MLVDNFVAMATIVQMFAYEDSQLSNGYSTQNVMEIRNDTRLVLLCVDICLRNIACMSIFYNSVSKACRLHDNVFYNSASFVMETGWRYFRTVGDPKCDVYNGFVHQRDAGFCYRAESDLLTSSLAENACAAESSALAILDSAQKQNVVVGTLNFLSTKDPAPTQLSTGEPVFQGCYDISEVDNLSLELTDITLTVQKCMDRCQQLGRTHTMLETQKNCYCGDLQTTAVRIPSDSACNKICSDGKYCGNLSNMPATYEHVTTSTAGPSFVGFYIGATLNTSTSQWIWRDSTVVVYNAFDTADDSPLLETCAVMASDVEYRWYSEACTYTAGYVCEIDL